MADKNLLQLPLAITASGALLYGIQDNTDKAFPASVLQGSEQPQGANLVYAGPPTAPGAFPTFRPLVQADIPDLSGLYLSSNGGTLVGATINNSTIVGGTISGATAVWDDDKFSVRNVTDTTKVIRFSAATITAGQTRIFSWPDANGQVVTDNASQNLTNKSVILRASGSAAATFRIPHGTPPSSPVNGDMWTTNAGLYVQANNVTIGPLAASASSTVTTFNGRQGAVSLTSGDVTSALGYIPYNPATGSFVQKTGDTMTGTLTIDASSLRVQNWGGVPNNGVVHFGNGGSYIFKTPTTFELFHNGAGFTAIINSNGTVWTTGNFDPATKVNKAGDTMTGGLVVGGEFRVGSGSSGEARIVGSASGEVYWDSRASVAGATPNGTAFYRANSHTWTRSDGVAVGSLSNTGALRVTTVQAYGGAFGTQSGMIARGWSNNITRWLDVMESDGSLSMYAYNSAGASGVQLVNYKTTSTGGQNLTSFTGVVTASGGFGPSSDPRLKQTDSLRPVDNALQKVYNLNVKYGKYHEWYNPDGKERVFLMADDALKYYAPQAVMEDVIEKDGKKYDGWSADQMIALLVKAVQELTDEVRELKEKQNG